MTNVPFINKITNELSKRKLKSDVVANAILDIAVGNDRLDDLIANGVTQSDLESLTIGGLTTEQTEALGKIEGLESSASEIDNSVNTYVNVLDFNSGAKTSSSINKAIEFARANNIWTVYIPNGEYDLRFAKNADIPSFPVGQKVPSLWLSSNIRLLGESRKGVILKLSDTLTAESCSNIGSYSTENVVVENLTIKGNKIDDTFQIGEREGIDLKDCDGFMAIGVDFIDIEHEALDIDLSASMRLSFNIENKIKYLVIDCEFNNVGGTGVHNADWCIVKNSHFNTVANNRYAGFKLGKAGTEGQGAIDTFGHVSIYDNVTFKNCPRAVHRYGEFPFEGHTHIMRNCTVTEGSAQADKLKEIHMAKKYGEVYNTKLVSAFPKIECLLLDNTKVYASPIIPTNEYFEFFRVQNNCEFYGLSLWTQGELRGKKSFIKDSIVDKTGNTQAVGAVWFAGVGANGVTVDNNTIIQDGNYSACGVHDSVLQSGHCITNNTIVGGTHSIKVSGLSKVIGNTCSGSTSWGITVEGNNNIVSLNTTTKATRDQGIGNVVVNNIQLP